jgi:hypothetical protein
MTEKLITKLIPGKRVLLDKQVSPFSSVEISRILWNHYLHYAVQNCTPLVSDVSENILSR